MQTFIVNRVAEISSLIFFFAAGMELHSGSFKKGEIKYIKQISFPAQSESGLSLIF